MACGPLIRCRVVKVAMLVLASGRGTRLGAEVPKAYVPVEGQTLLERSVRRLAALPVHRALVVAVNPDDRDTHLVPVRKALEDLPTLSFTDGGATRQASMENAFGAAPSDCDLILVHDAARPFFPATAVLEALEHARTDGASLLAVRTPDTLKRVGPEGLVETTIDRSTIWAAQTPQIIRRDVLETALEKARADGFIATDDVSLCEHAGLPVRVVESVRTNLKITTAEDLLTAERLAARFDRRDS